MDGSIAPCLAFLFPDPAVPGLIPSIPQISEEKVVNVHQRWRLEQSGQWLENVDLTSLLVLASGKLVLQKNWLF